MERLAVFLLLAGRAARRLRTERAAFARRHGCDLALHYPLHVTVRGRFWGPRREVEEAIDSMADLWPVHGLKIDLLAPERAGDNLVWRRVAPESPGWRCLVRLHHVVSAVLQDAVSRDEVPDEFQYAGYRPHVTVGWMGADPPGEMELGGEAISLEAAGLALARYPGAWPCTSFVEIERTFPNRPALRAAPRRASQPERRLHE